MAIGDNTIGGIFLHSHAQDCWTKTRF